MQKLSKRTLASRANGAKSRGPLSEIGLRRSSANSLRHGLLAGIVLLKGESTPLFAQFFDEHLQKLNPADGVEYAIVEEIVAAAWRLRRVWNIEVTLFDAAQQRSTADTGSGAAADAFTALGANNQLQLLDRYETRLHRMYQRSLATLQNLRKFPETRPNPEPSEPVLPPKANPNPEPKTEETAVLPNEPNSDLTTNPDNNLPLIIPTPKTPTPDISEIPEDTTNGSKPITPPDND